MPLIAIYAVAGVGLYFGFPRSPDFRKRRLIALLASLPAIWLFEIAWGALFWRSQYSDVTVYPVLLAPLVSLLVCCFYVWRLKGARLFVIAYALLNLHATIFFWFIAGMAVTGDWL